MRLPLKFPVFQLIYLFVKFWLNCNVKLFLKLFKDFSIIVEGRDITTVVFPEADLKLLITAEESERIRRRAKQLYGDDYAG